MKLFLVATLVVAVVSASYGVQPSADDADTKNVLPGAYHSGFLDIFSGSFPYYSNYNDRAFHRHHKRNRHQYKRRYGRRGGYNGGYNGDYNRGYDRGYNGGYGGHNNGGYGGRGNY